VVSDPEAVGDDKVEVQVKGNKEIKLNETVKKGMELPEIKIPRDIADKLKISGFISFYTIKDNKKINLHFRAIIDESLKQPEVSLDLLKERFGQEEVKGYVYRTKSFQIALEPNKINSLLGLKIGDTFNGSIIGLKELKLKITGGSDNSGFPMRSDIMGGVKIKPLLSGPPGYRPKDEGVKARKIVRGNSITKDIAQINAIIVR